MPHKAKPAERRSSVLFADAARVGLLPPGQGAELRQIRERTGEIVAAYYAFKDVDRSAHVADLTEIEADDFNLNINRYVDTAEPVGGMSVELVLCS